VTSKARGEDLRHRPSSRSPQRNGPR
jgi:hypothetical protein